MKIKDFEINVFSKYIFGREYSFMTDSPLHSSEEHVFLREYTTHRHTRGERGGQRQQQEQTQYNRTDWEGQHGIVTIASLLYPLCSESGLAKL